MKTITSKVQLLKKLKKQNLLSDGIIFYLSDFHRTKVGPVVAYKLISDRTLEKTKALSAWFENEWHIRKPTGTHLEVDIFYCNERKQYFFKVPKGVYDMDLYSDCVKKLDYLKNLGEKLK